MNVLVLIVSVVVIGAGYLLWTRHEAEAADTLGVLGRFAARQLLWSRVRLLGMAGAVLVLSVVVAAVFGSGSSGGDRSGTGDQAAPVAVELKPTPEPTPTLTPTPGPTVTPAPTVAAQTPSAAATGFVTAWASHSPLTTWQSKVAPLATGRLANRLRYTDPANVAATRVTGSPEVLAEADGATDVLVPTDVGVMVVTVTRAEDGTWLADGIERRQK